MWLYNDKIFWQNLILYDSFMNFNKQASNALKTSLYAEIFSLKILEKNWDESLPKYIFAVASQNR